MLSLLLAVPLLLAQPLQVRDTKVAADEIVHRLRASQAQDLSWGKDLADACRVLDALARSPRAYTDLDGPFFRVPAERIARAAPGSVDDGLVALALGPCLTGPLAAARDAALQRLLSGPPPHEYAALLALRTYPAAELKLPEPAAGDEPAVAVLLAADPASVAPPPVSDLPAWTRWARAAKLRGVTPKELPALPDPGPQAGFAELLSALETVNALHGVMKGAPTPQLPVEQRPGFVAAGQDLKSALDRAWGFLDSHQRGGTFGLGVPGAEDPEPGITAMALSAALWIADQTGRERPEWIDQGLDFLVALQKEDGSIQLHGLDVYTTSVAIEALAAAGRAKDKEVLEKARAFLVVTQSDEGEGYASTADPHYGGIGYGGDERPDLSNTQMALEAAARAGLSRSDPFFAKARVFLERCQNFGEGTPASWPRPAGGKLVTGVDGGGTYMPGNSFAGENKVAEGVWEARSYGSMSYALAKSYVLCGATPDDPRVDAVVRWLGRNFTVDTNPGYANAKDGLQGLYYYYLVMSRTLDLLPEGTLKDADGKVIEWRQALTRKLLDQQRTDGSWINADSPRWWEGAPPLATAYAVLSLQSARP